MKLHQMKSIVAVVSSEMNLTRAAVALNATQPGVSAHIRAVETELGEPLFVRDKRRFVGLTPLGATLIPDIIDVVRKAEDLADKARALTSPMEKPIIIASGPTPAQILMRTIGQFVTRYPKTKVEVRNFCQSAIMEELTSSRADIGLFSDTTNAPSSIETYPCYSLGWIAIMPEDCPLATETDFSLSAVGMYPLITYDKNFASSEVIRTAFRAAGIKLNIALGIGDVASMKRLVRSGVGVAIVRSGNYNPDRDTGIVARSLDHMIPSSQIHAGVRKDLVMSSPLRNIMELLRAPLSQPETLESPIVA